MLASSTQKESPHLRIVKSQFQDAYESLQKVLSEEVKTRLKNVKFPDCSVIISVETAAAELETALDKLIESQNIPEDAQSRTRTAKEIIRKWFRASYPFAQVFLTIGVTGSAVFLSFSVMLMKFRYLY